jgi:hypothetical protein
MSPYVTLPPATLQALDEMASMAARARSVASGSFTTAHGVESARWAAEQIQIRAAEILRTLPKTGSGEVVPLRKVKR